MKRIIVLHHTGSDATNLKLARRIARKMQSAQKQGSCVLIDFEDVLEVSPEFLTILTSAALRDKVKFCGLPPVQQRVVALSARREEA